MGAMMQPSKDVRPRTLEQMTIVNYLVQQYVVLCHCALVTKIDHERVPNVILVLDLLGSSQCGD